jgi:hypothetical protein
VSARSVARYTWTKVLYRFGLASSSLNLRDCSYTFEWRRVSGHAFVDTRIPPGLRDSGWFINEGLKAAERIVVDGAICVAPDIPLKIVGTVASTETAGKTIVEKGGASHAEAPAETRPAAPASASGAAH